LILPGFPTPAQLDLIEGQPNRHYPAGVDVAFRPFASDIATQANVGFRGEPRTRLKRASLAKRMVMWRVSPASHLT
jgi:hypothetical protein